MADEETVWTWRWRCKDCGTMVKGEGDKVAMLKAADRIRAHQAMEAQDELDIQRAIERHRLAS